jgi:hypothetical protein
VGSKAPTRIDVVEMGRSADSSDTPDLAASMAVQGRGVWPGLAATMAARDGARSICLHATKIRKVLTATARDSQR